MKFYFAFLAILLVGFSSCNKKEKVQEEKNQEESEAMAITAEDQALAQSVWDDIGNQVDGSSSSVEQNESTWNICAKLIVDSIGDPFPLEVTIDFGEEGCVGQDGKTRKGQLNYTMSGWLREEGSVFTVSTANYYVNDYKVEGIRQITNNGKNASDQLHYLVTVQDASVTDLQGRVLSWSSSRTRTWVEGENTGFFTKDENGNFMGFAGITDDIYEITGSAFGTNRNNLDYTLEITVPLRVQLDCRWVTKGAFELYPEGFMMRKFDYGNGDCDNKATVETSLGVEEITLRG